LTGVSVGKVVATADDNCSSKLLHSCGECLRATGATPAHHLGKAEGTACQQGEIQGAPPQGAPENSSLETQTVVPSPDGFQLEGYLNNLIFSLSFPTKLAEFRTYQVTAFHGLEATGGPCTAENHTGKCSPCPFSESIFN